MRIPFRHAFRFALSLGALGVGTGASADPGEALGSGLALAAPHADAAVLDLAAHALSCAEREQLVSNTQILSVIDYSRPSTEPRLWVFDLAHRKLLFEELVAHGKNTGDNRALRFSNAPGSLMSSIGVFLTADTYVGHNGYSLRLRGLEPGFNDRALERDIVVHGASYVDSGAVALLGRLGRSFGCPAVRPAIAHRLIDTIRDGSLLVAYYPDQRWLQGSTLVHGCTAAPQALAAQRDSITDLPDPSRAIAASPR